METLLLDPSFQTALKREPKVLEASFGDGYGQFAANGINNNPQEWDVRWDELPKAEATELDGFLARHGGWKPFWWTPPGALAPRKFRCRTWTRTAAKPGHDSMSAVFKEAFDL